jgi:hypothetical protein
MTTDAIPDGGVTQADREAADRECTVCAATVAAWPEVMCCHCQTVPWKRLATAPVAPAGEVERMREALLYARGWLGPDKIIDAALTPAATDTGPDHIPDTGRMIDTGPTIGAGGREYVAAVAFERHDDRLWKDASEREKAEYRHFADGMIAAVDRARLTATQDAGAGMVLVPREPTEAMMNAGLYHSSHDATWEDVNAVWKGMFDSIMQDGGTTTMLAAAHPAASDTGEGA